MNNPNPPTVQLVTRAHKRGKRPPIFIVRKTSAIPGNPHGLHYAPRAIKWTDDKIEAEDCIAAAVKEWGAVRLPDLTETV